VARATAVAGLGGVAVAGLGDAAGDAAAAPAASITGRLIDAHCIEQPDISTDVDRAAAIRANRACFVLVPDLLVIGNERAALNW
jgi:hypothetical protein